MLPEARLFQWACLLTLALPVLLVSTVLSDIACCAIGLLFLIHCHQNKKWSWLKESWVQLLGLLWVFMIARGAFAEFPRDALARAVPFGRYIVFAAALARWTLADTLTRRRFQLVLTGFIAFAAFDGLIQYALGRDLVLHKLIHDPVGGHIRLDGIFSKPILGIMLAWLAFPALQPQLAGGLEKRGNPLMLALGLLLIILLAVVCSGERMALILMLIGLMLCVFLMPMSKRHALALLGSIFLLLAIFLAASPLIFQRQFASTVQTLTHWQKSPYGLLLTSDLALAQEQPVIGLGANQFRTACVELYANDPKRLKAMCNLHPHNIYLEWLIEEGTTGLLLFAAFVLCIFKDCLVRWRILRADPLFAGLFIAFILRVWPLMSSTGFFSRWGAPPFWLVLGALLVYTAGKGEQNAGASLTVEGSGL